MQKSQVTGHGVNSNVFQKMIRVGGDGMADISTKQLEQMEKELQESEENIRATQDFEEPEKRSQVSSFSRPFFDREGISHRR